MEETSAAAILAAILEARRAMYERAKALPREVVSFDELDAREIELHLAELDLLRERQGGTARQVQLALVLMRERCAERAAELGAADVAAELRKLPTEAP